MVNCDYCGRDAGGLFHKCKFCGKIHCSKHLQPELHNCEGLKRYKQRNTERWQSAVVSPMSRKETSYKKSNLLEKIKYWLRGREHHQYDYKGRLNYLIITIVLFVTSLTGLNIFYSNVQKLNEINFWIIRLGGVLILISLFFVMKFGWRSIKEVINIIKRQRNWLKYLIIILVIVLLWQAYTHKETVLNPVFELYNKTNFTLFSPIDTNNLSLGSGLNSLFNSPTINDTWVHNFMSIVSQDREARGLPPLIEKNTLDNFAQQRFVKMQESPFISHYGFPTDAYNIGEVIYYPKGSTEQEYVDDLQKNAVLHWNLMMDSSFTTYGYHLEEGPNIEITGSCSITEIPGPNIDVKEFFNSHGCQTTETNDLWLVIDMS